MISDPDLIDVFVEKSIQRQEILLANTNLKAQLIYDSNQLFSKKEGLIATSNLIENPFVFLIKLNSSYWEPISYRLAEKGFIYTTESNINNFYTFQYCKLPPGYELNCTKSVGLWRAWWKYRKNVSPVGIPLELLVRSRGTWYPIRDLIISDGVLYVKTLGSEITLHAEDLITWLSKSRAN
jgi:hypothetical protein